jgi:hypothetical protein
MPMKIKRATRDPVELTAQLLKIVGLTVENKHVTSARRHHWLVTRGGKIENGESPMPQGDTRCCVNPDASIVRSTVTKCTGHSSYDSPHGVLSGPTLKVNEACKTAHVFVIATRREIASKTEMASPLAVR